MHYVVPPNKLHVFLLLLLVLSSSIFSDNIRRFYSPGACEIPAFSRCSFSLHALKNLDYSCGHKFHKTGNILWISTGPQHRFEITLITFHNGDYARILIHCPVTATVAINTLLCNTDISLQSVPYLDIAKSLTGTSKDTMRQILMSERTTGVPPKVRILELFRCPVCDKEKTKTIASQPSSNIFFFQLVLAFILILFLQNFFPPRLCLVAVNSGVAMKYAPTSLNAMRSWNPQKVPTLQQMERLNAV
jgi:hypothetical protein